MFHEGGDARTYSGVWPGRASRPKTSFFRHFTGMFQGSAPCRKARVFSQRFLKPDRVGFSSGELPPWLCYRTKKRDARKSLHQPGCIMLEGGFAARQCVVKDLSATGAKLTIDDPNSLPAKLRLAFSRDARTGRPCEVVWRRGKSVGIKFVR